MTEETKSCPDCYGSGSKTTTETSIGPGFGYDIVTGQFDFGALTVGPKTETRTCTTCSGRGRVKK